MQRLEWNALGEAERARALARPQQRSDAALQAAVRVIVDDVRTRGWRAAAEHGLRLDGEEPRRVAVASAAEQARRSLDPAELEAIELARRNICAFHESTRPSD